MRITFRVITFFFCISLILNCNNKDSEKNEILYLTKVINIDSTSPKIKLITPQLYDTLNAPFNDEDLVDFKLFSKDAILDIRYASENNFLDTILYPCAKCLLRYEVIKDLLRAESEFKKMGYRIKLYDCYRPHSVQVIMWEKMPIVGLVADPRTGSRHNRGSAVDITICDQDGNEIDMGTDHDDLSLKGRTFYRGFNDTIFNNRMLLRKVLQRNHFIGINSEWWHFSHDCGTKYKVSNIPLNCEDSVIQTNKRKINIRMK